MSKVPGVMTVFSLDEQGLWLDLLSRASRHDVYHLPSYHAMAARRGEGNPKMFVYLEGDTFIALPLMFRDIGSVPGLSAAGKGLMDATSVYGYPGPIASSLNLPEDFVNSFQEALEQTLSRMNVLAVFSRLNPLLPQAPLLLRLGEYERLGQTISIDLSLPNDVQVAQFRKSHRYEIRRLTKLGVTCELDERMQYLKDFTEIYADTMLRVGADPYYSFDTGYFEDLISSLGENIHLFVCRYDGVVIAGGLFMICNGIVQYHLSGTRSEFVRMAPVKLLIDTVRAWAMQRGAMLFHLGGGVASQDDSLFQFKSGFSERRHDFSVWRWIIDSKTYERICQTKKQYNAEMGLRIESEGFFPLYRSPVLEQGTPTASLKSDTRRTAPVGIYGAGGFGKEVGWLIESCNSDAVVYEIMCFVDDDVATHKATLHGIRVLSLDAASRLYPNMRLVSGVATPKVRMRVVEKAVSAGYKFETLVHPNVAKSSRVVIGEGSIICAGCVLTLDITLGKHVQININSTVGHDVTIDDFCTLGPGVHVAGWVRVGKRVFIGAGAVIINGSDEKPLMIGDDAVIGAASCVISSVSPNTTVFGVPARRVPIACRDVGGGV